MPLVSEMVHPKGFSFQAQKQIVMFRGVRQLTWDEIAERVVTLENEKLRARLCADYYHKFNAKVGRVKTKYDNSGNTVSKADKSVERFLVNKLLQWRRKGPCTSTMLQLALAREKNVKLTARYIRRLLQKNG